MRSTPQQLGTQNDNLFFSGWLLGWFMASATDATGMEWSRVVWSAVNWGLPLVIKHGWFDDFPWFSLWKPPFIVKFPASHDDTVGVPNLAEPWTINDTCCMSEACHQHHIDPSFLCIQRSSERRVQAGGASIQTRDGDGMVVGSCRSVYPMWHRYVSNIA